MLANEFVATDDPTLKNSTRLTMQTQVQYITNLAKQYKDLAKQPANLYTAINELPEDVLNDVFNAYGNPESDFKPVNLLRAEVARQRLNGTKIDDQLVTEVLPRF